MIDDMAERADKVYEHELQQNKTKDANKKESNAQTNSYLLNKRTSDPGAPDRPIPTAPPLKPDDYEEVEGLVDHEIPVRYESAGEYERGGVLV